jgi:hypothetical protein
MTQDERSGAALFTAACGLVVVVTVQSAVLGLPWPGVPLRIGDATPFGAVSTAL